MRPTSIYRAVVTLDEFFTIRYERVCCRTFYVTRWQARYLRLINNWVTRLSWVFTLIFAPINQTRNFNYIVRNRRYVVVSSIMYILIN